MIKWFGFKKPVMLGHIEDPDKYNSKYKKVVLNKMTVKVDKRYVNDLNDQLEAVIANAQLLGYKVQFINDYRKSNNRDKTLDLAFQQEYMIFPHVLHFYFKKNKLIYLSFSESATITSIDGSNQDFFLPIRTLNEKL